MSVIQECWINGVSTRKMMRVFKAFGVEDISAAQVSQVNKELDAEVSQFRHAPLSKSYPVVWIDALYEKIRDDNKVTSKAVMVAMALNSEGKKVILAIEPMDNESTDTWTVFFDKLKSRGLTHIGLLVSDAHLGIQSALKCSFIGTSWQRCKVHFMRNILARVPLKHKEMIGRQLSIIFTQFSFDLAKQMSKEVIDKFSAQCPEAMDVLSNGIEDALQFFHFPELPFTRTSSTNHLERLNLEIRRRSNVVGTFPSINSYLRLIGSYLIEYQADWDTGKAVIKPDRIIQFNDNLAAKIAA
jgi:transposase-like protein